MEWNHKSWLDSWTEAVKVMPKFRRRQYTGPLLVQVYKDTVARVKAGGWNNYSEYIDLKLNPDIEADTVFYDSPVAAVQTEDRGRKTEVAVLCTDCLELARDLQKCRPDLQVCVLNLASYKTPGGGVIGGAGAQEEYLFRCSDYYRSLYQFGRHAAEYGLTPHPKHRYPLHERFGAVFSRGVTVFRGPQDRGYQLMTPIRLNFIAIAAHKDPATITMPNGEVRYTPAEEEYMTHKARTILRIAHENGQNALILGALGCGAFHNPPKHVAEIFKKVIAEPEFDGIFEYIYFAIINDHNSNGNYESFYNVFSDTTETETLTDKESIFRTLLNTGRQGINHVLHALERNGFYDAPGSVTKHSNYKGGLAEHSLAVYRYAMELKGKEPEMFGSVSDESIALTALLHDICKADVYFIKNDGTPGKSMRKFPIGHGEKSVIMLLRLGLELTEDEMLAIRWHMGEHTFKDRSVDKENFDAALKSSAGPLIKLIQRADGMAANCR